jgi:hypothetical protein
MTGPPGRVASANKAAIDAGQTDVVWLLACLIWRWSLGMTEGAYEIWDFL